MRILNPAMGRRVDNATDPEANDLKKAKFLKRLRALREDQKFWRLYSGKSPIGVLVAATAAEIHDWNKNARLFYRSQLSLGRNSVPLVLYQEVRDYSASPMWRVKFTLNGQPKEMEVCATCRTTAKREFETISPVAARMVEIEKMEDEEDSE